MPNASGDKRSGRLVVIVFVVLTAAFVAIVSYGMHALRIPPGGIPDAAPPPAASPTPSR